MFKKLLSNLPFNPSLINQVAFYARRMHQEERLRRTGFVLLALSVAVQAFAVFAPPQPTLAESSNDILRGGFSTREQAASLCRNNTQDFANIMTYYGITCETLASSETVTLRSTDYERKLDSLGRNRQGRTIARTNKPTDEYSVPINGTTYYMRNLWAWDSGAYSSYKFLRMTNADGLIVMVMFNCGNIVTVGQYTPPPPPTPPEPETPPAIPPPPQDVCPYIPDLQTSTEQCDICPNIPGQQNNAEECYPCPEAREDASTTACVTFDKKARNDTANTEDADGTTAKPDDIITYTLSVTNEGSTSIPDFVIEENMSDVLQYSTVVDLDGGKMNEDNIVTWPKATLGANSTLTKTLAVKVKDPIPETPVSASDPGSFDLIMTNVFYDKSINIHVPTTPAKTTEQVVRTLPNTGPGTSLMIALSATVVIGYFFARSRLLARELDLVREDYATGSQ